MKVLKKEYECFLFISANFLYVEKLYREKRLIKMATINNSDSSEIPLSILEIIDKGYHIFNLKKAKLPNFYPDIFSDYPGARLKELFIGDFITIKAFFLIESKEPTPRIEGGYIDLKIEQIESDRVIACVLTNLPEYFPLGPWDAIEVLEEEILYKIDPNFH